MYRTGVTMYEWFDLSHTDTSIVGGGGGVVPRLVHSWLVRSCGHVVDWAVVVGGGCYMVDRLVVRGVVLRTWVSVAVTFLPRIETDLWYGDSITWHQRVTENINLKTENSIWQMTVN